MKNKYFILRHGESLSNVKHIVSCWPEKFYSPLTRKGRKQIKTQAEKLKKKKIDLVFASDILRTRQTAEIVGREVKIKPKYDKRLREYNMGIFNGGPSGKLKKFFTSKEKRFTVRSPKGENYNDIKKRMYGFLKDINKKYSEKNILIVSHEIPLILLIGAVKGFSNQEILKYRKKSRIGVGDLRKLGL